MSDPVVKLVCQFICLCSFFDFARLLPLDSDMCSELLCDVLGVRNDKLSIVTDIYMWYLDWCWTWWLKYIVRRWHSKFKVLSMKYEVFSLKFEVRLKLKMEVYSWKLNFKVDHWIWTLNLSLEFEFWRWNLS